MLDTKRKFFHILLRPRISSSKFLVFYSRPRILLKPGGVLTPPYLPGSPAHSAGIACFNASGLLFPSQRPSFFDLFFRSFFTTVFFINVCTQNGPKIDKNQIWTPRCPVGYPWVPSWCPRASKWCPRVTQWCLQASKMTNLGIQNDPILPVLPVLPSHQLTGGAGGRGEALR